MKRVSSIPGNVLQAAAAAIVSESNLNDNSFKPNGCKRPFGVCYSITAFSDIITHHNHFSVIWIQITLLTIFYTV